MASETSENHEAEAAAAARPSREDISMNGYIPKIMRGELAEAQAAADAMIFAQGQGKRSFESRQQEMHDDAIRLQNVRDLRRVFDRIDSGGDGYLDEKEIAAYLVRLGYTPQRGEVAKLIWEIDDDGDGCVTWPEFQKTHERLVNYNFQSAKVAYEPRGFFNMIEFSVLDNDGSGSVDATEVITMFYRRYGRDGALKKLDGLVEQGSLDDSINFMDFLAHDTKMRQNTRRVMKSEYTDRRRTQPAALPAARKGRPV